MLNEIFKNGASDNRIGLVGIILVTIQTVILVASIYPTENALKKTFNEDGSRKQLQNSLEDVVHKQKEELTVENGFMFIRDRERILEKLDDICVLMAQTYWANTRDKNTIELSIKNSHCYAVIDTASNKIVGFARVITDNATMFYLCDVIVHEEYRDRGIGKKLVEWVVQEETGKPKRYGMLLTKDAQGLYEKFGFSEYKDSCMCIYK